MTRLTAKWIQKHRPDPKNYVDSIVIHQHEEGINVGWILVGGVYLCPQEIEDMKLLTNEVIDAFMDYLSVVKLDSIDANRCKIKFAERVLPIIDKYVEASG